ncbi:MAG TPA: hypothetical protein VF585_09450 [Chthoniobacterales bacterium]|jgi:hypothetical protein
MNLLKSILSLTILPLFGSVSSIHAQNPPAEYPLTKCVISDEKLGNHGKPVKVTHDGTDVYLCCKMCSKDFAKEADKFVAQVKEAAAKK